MKEFNIWQEGFSVMEGSAKAHLVATNIKANDFIDACKKFYDNDPLFYINEEYIPSYWGCRLFDNESDARKSFG